jgi:hypothetical protein
MSLRVAVSLVVACVLSFAIASYAGAAVCGGTTTCNCNDSIGSSYTMTADLNCSGAGVNTSDALRIFNRSNVVLDCDGYNIIGGDVLGANGVAVDGGSSNITIKNCTVRDFDRGISVKDSTRTLQTGSGAPT